MKKPPTLPKLLKLKEWLTLKETSQHISTMIGEIVSEADIYRYAISGHITLSVHFVNHTKGRLGRIGGKDEAIWHEFSIPDSMLPNLPPEAAGKTVSVMDGLQLDDERIINFDNAVVPITGVWDLLMAGGEYVDIEQKYQMLTDGPEIRLTCPAGAFVTQGKSVCQLMERFGGDDSPPGLLAALRKLDVRIFLEGIPKEEADELRAELRENPPKYPDTGTEINWNDDYHPAERLPADSVLVVRTSALLDFLELINGQSQSIEKPPTTTERHTFLVIIAALCNHANISLKARGTAKQIEGMTELLGAKITDETVLKVIRQIPDALEAREQ